MEIYDLKEIPEEFKKYFRPAEIGLEQTPEEYVAKMVEVFREVKRCLKKEGTLWLNLGDSYMSLGENRHKGWKDPKNMARGLNISEPQGLRHPKIKPKDLVGIPWRVAFALQQDGWYLRQDIIWHKPNPMPESVTDRCTKSHEYIFLLTKNQRYYFNNEAIREPHSRDWQNENWAKEGKNKTLKENSLKYNHGGKKTLSETYNPSGRNKRSVWTIPTKPFKEAHFATFPEDLVSPMIKAGCPKGGIVLDMFMGSGTTAVVAKKLGRNYVGVELNEKYIKIAEERLRQSILI